MNEYIIAFVTGLFVGGFAKLCDIYWIYKHPKPITKLEKQKEKFYKNFIAERIK